MKSSKKIVRKKTKPVRQAPVNEAHILELMTQWQMPIGVIAKNQNISKEAVKTLGKKFVQQKKLAKSVFDQLNRDNA